MPFGGSLPIAVHPSGGFANRVFESIFIYKALIYMDFSKRLLATIYPILRNASTAPFPPPDS